MTKRVALKWEELPEAVAKYSPEVVFFDLDDTLYDAEKCYSQALNNIGLDGENSGFQRARELVKQRLPGNTSARNRLLYFKCFIEQQTSERFSASAVLDLMHRYEAALILAIKEDWNSRRQRIEKVLEFFRTRYRLGLITNENVRTQLLKLSVIDPSGKFFNSVLVSEEVGYEKPHPFIFQVACERLKTIPSRAVMIGDNLIADIEGAEGFGMETCWLEL